MSGAILGVTSALLFATSAVALWHMRLPGHRLIWASLATATILMTVRSCMTWYEVTAADIPRTPDTTSELIAMLISLMMLGLTQITM